MAEALSSTRMTETHRVYIALKQEILDGRFQAGEALHEVELSARFGTSRTPIREALLRLEADGLLKTAPRRGTFVRVMTVDDFLEVYELRLALEPFAAELAARRIKSGAVLELKAALETIPADAATDEDFERLYDLDRRMHLAIAAGTRNGRIGRLVEGFTGTMRVVLNMGVRERHHEMHRSVGQILAALETRDGAAAEAAMRRHITDFAGVITSLARLRPGQD